MGVEARIEGGIAVNVFDRHGSTGKVAARVGAGAVIVLIAALLCGCGTRTEPPDLSPATYDEDYEASYEVLVDGKPRGTASFSVRRRADDRAPLEFTYEVAIDGIRERTAVLADADFGPIRSDNVIETGKGRYDITVKYAGRSVSIDVEGPDGSKSVERKAPDGTYDNGQVLMLVRAMPLEEGYTTSFNIVAPKGLALVPITIEVKERESVEIGSAARDCYLVELRAEGSTQRMWYTADETRDLVKYDNGATVMTLDGGEES